MRRLAPLLAACAAIAALVLAASAQAAFPGRNGRVAVSFSSLNEPDYGPPWHYDRAIQMRRPDRGDSQTPIEVAGCHQVTEVSGPPQRPVRGECSLQYLAPAVSPDGRWIAFDAGARIGLVRTDGTGMRLLAPAGADPANPAWSPGGGRVAFDSPRGTGPGAVHDLYVAAARDGAVATSVLRDAANPSWSRRGLLAFERGGRVWVSRTSGAHAHPVSGPGSSAPDFAPRDSRLVYAVQRGGRLTSVDASGRARRRLAAATAGAESPAFSPDGRMLAWGSFDGPVYVGRADGSRPRAISTSGVGAGYDFGAGSPSWQPLPRR